MDNKPPPIESKFIIEYNDGADQKMIELAKMSILLAFEEHLNDDLEKCKLMISKFEEAYKKYKWDVSIIKNGDSLFYYHKYYLKIKYRDYIIKIMNIS